MSALSINKGRVLKTLEIVSRSKTSIEKAFSNPRQQQNKTRANHECGALPKRAYSWIPQDPTAAILAALRYFAMVSPHTKQLYPFDNVLLASAQMFHQCFQQKPPLETH
eukprot:10247424-Karenia_brevis.AAC.1